MDLKIDFINSEQKEFFWHKERNGRMGGGFGNGKTYGACLRAFVYLSTFYNYRMVIARQTYKDLRATTMQTFFTICPKEFVYSHDIQAGLTVLKNQSTIYWLHLDAFDESSLRGLEINSALIDQAESVSEAIYLVLDARIGRWNHAKPPQWLKDQYLEMHGKEWPVHEKYNYPLVPNYIDILDNPSEDDVFHWIFRRYDSESLEHLENHFSVVRQTDESVYDPGTIKQMLMRDEEWIAKYFYGKTGISKARIHKIPDIAIIDPDKLSEEEWSKLLFLIKNKSSLTRVLDHGESAPTACEFFAAVNNVHINFAEYYIPNQVISSHRQAIHDISIELVGEANLNTFNDIADPQIFKKTAQKQGGFWSVSDEYAETDEITSPPLFWSPADNNEFATRNRINELLRLSPRFMHPITKISPSCGLYFIKKSQRHPYGVYHAILQTNSQRRQLLGTENGKSIYSDERAENIEDHAYDCLRYYCASHNQSINEAPRKAPRRSFANLLRLRKQQKEEFWPAIYERA